ncbi:MFS transporter [Shewanella sp. AS1]|uniref:MFS transporter n=1 Tax=Shewanella sp. AS1 TaxID=2907626 RepID=UPI001F1F69E4|nr:MFS transporter [Shewanella sp. AS1]MCE9679747.1 MFS transporter [Shewanella sp. AS1]
MILTRRFFPYFVTQCLGALNDNIYKNVLLLMATYSQIEHLPIGINLFVNLAAGLFILPFFLFSAYAGLVADNMDKAKLIRRLKLLEVAIMSCAAVAILTSSYLAMLVLLFLMGSQSAFFGPVKYSILPQALFEDELVKGNAWVEMGTFLSILLGTLGAGLLISRDPSATMAALLVVVLAGCGYLSSLGIPPLPAQGKIQHIKFAPLSGTWRSIGKVRANPSLWTAVLAISWFWFLGATYLTQFANFTKLYLHGDASVVALLLALFSIGIALGSFLCERLSFGHVELGLLPFGLAGLTLFGLSLCFCLPSLPSDPLLHHDLGGFLAVTSHYPVMLSLLMIGVSGGLFIVPLYAFIQSRAEKGQCAQAIAANNIVNALFMVGSAVLAILLLEVLGISIVSLFMLLASINLLVALFLFTGVAEFRQRFVAYLVNHLFNRLSVVGREKLPSLEAGIILCQVDSRWDLFRVLGTSTRAIHFVADPVLIRGGFFLSWFGQDLIPWPARAEGSTIDKQTLEAIETHLSRGELVCIVRSKNQTNWPEVLDKLLWDHEVAVNLMQLSPAVSSLGIKREYLAAIGSPLLDVGRQEIQQAWAELQQG